jgi:hypothetical protein
LNSHVSTSIARLTRPFAESQGREPTSGGAIETVSDRFSRTQLLSRGAKSGLALAVAGSSAGVLAGVARADTTPDGDLAWLRLLVGAELLAADFYGNALEAEPFAAAGEKALKRALVNDGDHYKALSGFLTASGQTPATADDIDFTYPKGTFATAGAIARTAVTLETIFLGAYLGAIGGVTTPSLLQPLAEMAANQAQHLTVFRQIAGRSAFDASFPAPLTIDAASDALAVYTS